MDDAELVRRCLNGDRAAFDELVRRHRDRVYSIAFHLLGDHDWAEDLAQDAFLRAFQRLALFDSRKGSFAVWLATLTTRLCLNALKKRRGELQWQADEGEEGFADEVAEVAPTPEEAWWEEERRIILRRLLMGLPPLQRAALLLRYGEEMGIDEIARTLQVPVGTVKAWLFRGRETLRRKLKEAGLL